MPLTRDHEPCIAAEHRRIIAAGGRIERCAPPRLGMHVSGWVAASARAYWPSVSPDAPFVGRYRAILGPTWALAFCPDELSRIGFVQLHTLNTGRCTPLAWLAS